MQHSSDLYSLLFYKMARASTWTTAMRTALYWMNRALPSSHRSCHALRELTDLLWIPSCFLPWFHRTPLTSPRTAAERPTSRSEQFLREHPESKFAKDTLKDKLHETLKELKTGTSNEEGSEKAVLQPDDVLTRLRSTDSHAM